MTDLESSSTFSLRTITVGLVAVTLLLTGVDVLLGFFQFVLNRPIPPWLTQLFHMGNEHNVPSLTSAIIAAVSAVFAWRIARYRRSRGPVFSWYVFALCLSLLAIDEGFALHERLPAYMDVFYTWLNENVWQHASDAAFLIPLLAGGMIVLIFLAFVLRLPIRTRLLLFMAGGLFASGAFLIEAAGFVYTSWLLTPIEECTEMLGLIVLLFALMDFNNRMRSAVEDDAPDAA